jgi:hypothetical protein
MSQREQRHCQPVVETMRVAQTPRSLPPLLPRLRVRPHVAPSRSWMCLRWFRKPKEMSKRRGGDGSSDKQLWWRHKGPQGNDTRRTVSWSPLRLCLVLRPRHPFRTAHPHEEQACEDGANKHTPRTHTNTQHRDSVSQCTVRGVGGLCAEPAQIAECGRLSCKSPAKRSAAQRKPVAAGMRNAAAAQGGTTQGRETEAGERERRDRPVLSSVVLSRLAPQHVGTADSRGCPGAVAISN